MGWDLLLYSWEELKASKRLLFFPITSTLAAAALLFAFFPSSPFGQHRWSAGQSLRLLLFYCALSFVMNFFNCALAACAQIRFSGGQPTPADGLRRALQRWDAILFWSLLTATVGVVLNAIEQRLSILGELLIRVVGFAWGMATFLVVPILVIEEDTAPRALRKSAQLLRSTWGEQLSVNVGVGAILLLWLLPGIAVAVIGYNCVPALLVIGVTYLVAILTGQQALETIFQVALYRYATGNTPGPFPADMLRNALRGKE